MFIPNTTCDYYAKLPATDNFGRHTFAPKVVLRCSFISIADPVQKSSVRADTSGSRGQAEQAQGDARYLFPASTALKLGDVIYKDGVWLEVIQFTPMRNVLGQLDHNQVDFRKREAI